MNEFQKLIQNPTDRIDLCVELTAVRVSELIAKQLERQNISRGEFARMMEVTPGRVSQILDPDSNPQLRTVARALAVLGLVMDVDAVPLESFSYPDKWVEIPSVQASVIQSHPLMLTGTCATPGQLKAANNNYALAA